MLSFVCDGEPGGDRRSFRHPDALVSRQCAKLLSRRRYTVSHASINTVSRHAGHI
jgi:hypothetical protein